MIQENFTYESVFRYLRSGYSEFTEDEIDRMENYCLALGIKGYKKWQQAWARKSREADEPELEKLNHLRVKFVEKIDPLVFVARQRKKTVFDITLAVYEFIVGEQIQEKLERQQQYFAEQGELALAKEYEQIYRIVLELFDKFAELLGEEPISLKEYCELLDAGFEEAKVGGNSAGHRSGCDRRCGTYKDQKYTRALLCRCERCAFARKCRSRRSPV